VGIALNVGLSQISLLFIYASMAIYTAAFLTFANHLARLASDKKKVRTLFCTLLVSFFEALPLAECPGLTCMSSP
jgi:hypothetical protein